MCYGDLTLCVSTSLLPPPAQAASRLPFRQGKKGQGKRKDAADPVPKRLPMTAVSAIKCSNAHKLRLYPYTCNTHTYMYLLQYNIQYTHALSVLRLLLTASVTAATHHDGCDPIRPVEHFSNILITPHTPHRGTGSARSLGRYGQPYRYISISRPS